MKSRYCNPSRNLAHRPRNRFAHCSRQFLHRCGREEIVPRKPPLLVVCSLPRHRHHAPIARFHPVYLNSRDDFPARCEHFSRNLLPHLPRPKLRIQKPLNQRRLRLLLRDLRLPASHSLFHKVRERFSDRQPLDPLRSPLRADLVARHTPNFLRIRLEERQIKFPSEPVNKKLFKIPHRLDREHRPVNVAASDAHRLPRTELAQRVRSQLDRITEKLPKKINPRLARPREHSQIDALRLVALLHRHLCQPPIHHPVALGEETVPADVHPVSLVPDRPRYPSHILAAFQHNGTNPRPRHQFMRSREPSRSRPNNDCCFVCHKPASVPSLPHLATATYKVTPITLRLAPPCYGV